MKKFILHLILVLCGSLLFISKAHSQSFMLANATHGTSYDGSYDLTTDAVGNIYSIGWFSGTFDADPGPATFFLFSNGNRDIYVSKCNSTGNLLWCFRMGGSMEEEGYTITLDSIGNLIVGGRFQSSFDADPSASGSFFLFNSGSKYDLFFAKYTINGAFVWAKGLTSINNYDDVEDILTDADNNIYICGSFKGIIDFDPSSSSYIRSAQLDDAYIAKYSPSGNLIWVRTFGGAGSDDATSMKWDADSFLYCSGFFSNYCTFNANPVFFHFTSFGFTDGFVAKLDTSGLIHWVKQIGSVGYDAAYGLDIKGDILALTGMFDYTVDFDPGPGSFLLTTAGLSDIFNMILTKDGSFINAERAGGVSQDYGMDIRIGERFQILSSGHFSNVANFGTGARLKNIVGVGGIDIYVALFDSSLSLNSVFSIGSSGQENVHTVHWFGLTEFFVNGYYSVIADVDPDSTISYNLVSAGRSDAFFAKYKINCSPLDSSYTIIGPSAICSNAIATFILNNSIDEYYFKSWSVPVGWTILNQNSDTVKVIVRDSSGMIMFNYVDYCNEERMLTMHVDVINHNTIYLQDSICEGLVYTFPDGSTGISDTIQTSYFNAVSGCDSIIVTDLKITQTVLLSDSITICNGSSYLFNGISIASSGLYTYTISTPGFCDTTYSLQLSVLPQSLLFQNKKLCIGDTLWVGFVAHTTGGTFIDTLVSSLTCDSIVISNVTLVSLDTTISISSGVFTSNQTNAIYQWYECGSMLTPIPNAVFQSLALPMNGSYAVVINLNGCVDTSSCIYTTTTSLNEQNIQSIRYYPNPVVDNLSIISDDMISDLSIFSLDGKLLFRKTLNENEGVLDLGNFERGMYLIELDNIDHRAHFFIIKM